MRPELSLTQWQALKALKEIAVPCTCYTTAAVRETALDMHGSVCLPCREAQATFQMVEMYLHPEIEVMWAQAEQSLASDQQPLQANLEAVAAAQKLLQDVHVTEDTALQHKASQVLQCLCCKAWRIASPCVLSK